MGNSLIRWLRRRPYDILLAVLAVMVLAIEPLRASPTGALFVSIVAAFVPLAAIVALIEDRRVLRVGVVLGVPAAVAMLQHSFSWSLLPHWVVLTFPLGVFLLANWVLLRHLLQSPVADRNLVRGGMCGYLMAGYTFAVAFEVVAYLERGAFLVNGTASGDRLDPGAAVYFSFVTLTSLGYGDIIPIGPAARSLAISEAIYGVLYLAVIISRLVALYPTADRQS